MILHLEEAKQILQIKERDKDTLIELYLPIVQKEIVERTKNTFKSQRVKKAGTGISFTSESIVNDDSDFISKGFRAGQDVIVEGSVSNDGIFEIDELTDEEMTLNLSNSDELFEEAIPYSITVTRVVFPKGLKLIACDILQHYLSNGHNPSKTSESIGSFSASYSDYEQKLTEKLSPYMKMSF